MTTKNRRGQRSAAESRERPYLLDRNGVPKDQTTAGNRGARNVRDLVRPGTLFGGIVQPKERTGREAL